MIINQINFRIRGLRISQVWLLLALLYLFLWRLLAWLSYRIAIISLLSGSLSLDSRKHALYLVSELRLN